MKYYFLISYLPEIHPDDKKLRYRFEDLLGERFHIAQEDWAQVELILLAGDMLQIEKILSGKEIEVEFTLYGQEFWKDQMKAAREVPEWLVDFFEPLVSEGFSPRNIDRIYQAYFDFAIAKASNPFLRSYLVFERDLRNLLTAIRARRKGVVPAEHLVGEGDLVDGVGRSSAEDFGLSKEFPFVDRLLKAKTPEEIEESVQRILWETIDEMTEPQQFEFEIVLGYLLKLRLLERNLALSEEQGLNIVRGLEEL